MKHKKIIFPAIMGSSFVLIIIITEFLIYNLCTTDISCLSFALLPLYPGIIITNLFFNSIVLEWFSNIIIYFGIGYGIGYLYQKYLRN